MSTSKRYKAVVDAFPEAARTILRMVEMGDYTRTEAVTEFLRLKYARYDRTTGRIYEREI